MAALTGVNFISLPPSTDECCLCKDTLTVSCLGHYYTSDQDEKKTHRFDQACIEKWFTHHPVDPTCPLCQAPVLNAVEVIPANQQECLIEYAFHGREDDLRTRLAMGVPTMAQRESAVVAAVISPHATDEKVTRIVRLLLSNGPVSLDIRARAQMLATACFRSDIANLFQPGASESAAADVFEL